MKSGYIFTIVALAVFIAAGSTQGAIISGNFCSEAPIADFPSGKVPAFNWNDLTSPAGFGANDSSSSLIYDNGAPAPGASIAWTVSEGGSQNTNDAVFRPLPPATTGLHIDDGHDQMMAGYLQASKNVTAEPVITLKATGLDTVALGGSYSVYVYFDGNGDVESDTSRALFRIWGSEQDFIDGLAPLETYYGRDATGTNYAVSNTGADPDSEYVPITSTDEFNPTEGNYVVFDGLEGNEFFVRISGVAGQHGAALNGFQIVPEPATMAILAVGGLAIIKRRSR
jgi:hypothetical protein